MVKKTDVSIPSLDGHPLGATLYQAVDCEKNGKNEENHQTCNYVSTEANVASTILAPAPEAKAIFLVAGATGVPQGFYRRFAEAAVTQGFCVLTFDYRGIGRSKNAPLKGFKMDYLDWAKKDLASVIHYASDFQLPIYIIGHSYGGHAIGLLPDLDNIKGAWTFGTGAGWHGWMPKAEQWRVRFMWNVIAPIFIKIYGYLAWSRLGMGEDLPLDAYRQWKRWCSFPNYFFDDPEMKGVSESFDRIKFPLVAVNSTDDDWATPASRDAFMSHYRNAQLRLETIKPDKRKTKSIGHMGYFKSQNSDLWQRVFDWVHQEHKFIELSPINNAE